MSIPIPRYLRHLAIPLKEQGTWTHFSIRCPCRGNRFWIYQNSFTKEENALVKPVIDAWNEIYDPTKPRAVTTDENGQKHYWRLFQPLKGLDGAHQEIIVPKCPFFMGISVLKATCAACGKEHLLFDNRIHGYDGMTGEHTREVLEYVPSFKLKCKTAVSLEIKVENDASLEVFEENTALGFTEEQYSDSFSWMVIYKTDEKGKKTKIFDTETA